MKVLFYSPYIPEHFGGGEKHLFDVATTVTKHHDVFIALPSYIFRAGSGKANIKKIKKAYESFLNYPLDKISFIESKLFSGSIVSKLRETREFDYVYHVTDGSFFFSAAKQNNLHVQIPFQHNLTAIDRLKLKNWKIINTNSEFTKSFIESYWKVPVTIVHNPLVSLDEIKPSKKKNNVILNVGRFFKQLHSKRQDVLVTLFKQFVDENPNLLQSWKLVLVGAVEDESFLEQVKQLAKGYKIEIYTKVSRKQLLEWYKKAAIYWHATGYGVNENQYPHKVEHFGISTIEAMAAGCVPVVINKGGQKEIIGKGLQKLLWDTPDECIQISKKLIKSEEYFSSTQTQTVERVKMFSAQEFEKGVWSMFPLPADGESK